MYNDDVDPEALEIHAGDDELAEDDELGLPDEDGGGVAHAGISDDDEEDEGDLI